SATSLNGRRDGAGRGRERYGVETWRPGDRIARARTSRGQVARALRAQAEDGRLDRVLEPVVLSPEDRPDVDAADVLLDPGQDRWITEPQGLCQPRGGTLDAQQPRGQALARDRAPAHRGLALQQPALDAPFLEADH